MFTGIITDIGTISSTEQRGDLRLWIDTAYDLDSIDIGASIACSGACMTVVAKQASRFAVDISDESLSRTAAARWRQGARLNLERALKLGDELGGHIVTGHVDAVGTIHSMTPVGDSHEIWIAGPADIAAYIAPKGSVCLDGTSLTVNRVEDVADGVRFSFNLIPHSAAQTTWGAAGTGDEVNIEIDTMARYLGRMKQLMETK
ncbi:riboflavin synthase [Pacificimonas sp. WHA3]|uniref:Riboflavin synthase n=1 Tax=Pacificimonas pallii TaxID=2827236 RepID=A0ABS6SE67_9SPHN|nr:riboflavin synthase [Pacificimonas pallii]MBV7256211.1 riboflavin synthase [Pacificimonas pallii]